MSCLALAEEDVASFSWVQLTYSTLKCNLLITVAVFKQAFYWCKIYC